jgi:hypothetical protein
MSEHPGVCLRGIGTPLERVSELLLFNANSSIFQLYNGEKKLIFNEMMMKSALTKDYEIGICCFSAKHQH